MQSRVVVHRQQRCDLGVASNPDGRATVRARQMERHYLSVSTCSIHAREAEVSLEFHTHGPNTYTNTHTPCHNSQRMVTGPLVSYVRGWVTSTHSLHLLAMRPVVGIPFQPRQFPGSDAHYTHPASNRQIRGRRDSLTSRTKRRSEVDSRINIVYVHSVYHVLL